jgi:hypothetical protein
LRSPMPTAPGKTLALHRSHVPGCDPARDAKAKRGKLVFANYIKWHTVCSLYGEGWSEQPSRSRRRLMAPHRRARFAIGRAAKNERGSTSIQKAALVQARSGLGAMRTLPAQRRASAGALCGRRGRRIGPATAGRIEGPAAFVRRLFGPGRGGDRRRRMEAADQLQRRRIIRGVSLRHLVQDRLQ